VMEDGGGGWSLMSIRGVIREGASRMRRALKRLVALSRPMGGVACVQMMRQVTFVLRRLQDFDTSLDEERCLVVESDLEGKRGCGEEEDCDVSCFGKRQEVDGGREVGNANRSVERQGGGRAMGEQGCRKKEDRNASCFAERPEVGGGQGEADGGGCRNVVH